MILQPSNNIITPSNNLALIIRQVIIWPNTEFSHILPVLRQNTANDRTNKHE